MDKILFSNSFENLMVALGAKTSDSGYAVPLINKTSGAPQGYMEMSALAQVLGESNPFYSVNTSWYTKAKIGTIGRYQNKMLLIRYGNVTSMTQNTALISVNNRDSTTYFSTICKSGSPIIYYKNTSNGTELYLMYESEYSLFEVYIFSNKNANWSIKVEESNIDFSTLTSVNL